MADVNINGLGSLASPAADDVIPIWDTSAGQTLKVRRDTFVGATITGGGTIATGGFTLTVAATGTAALMGTAVFNVGVQQRASQTLSPNYVNYIGLAPSVPSYSSQTYLLAILAWDVTLNNPFDQSLWLLGGTGGVYTAYKIGGGTNIVVTINSNEIRISNAHASTSAVVVADLIVIKA